MVNYDVWDKLEKLEMALGAYGTLEELAKALGTITLEENLDYIIRVHDIDLDDYSL